VRAGKGRPIGGGHAEPVKPEPKADAEPAKPEPSPAAAAVAAPATPAAAATPDTAAAVADTAPAAPAAPATPGPAWFGLADGKGVVKLENGKLTTIALPDTLNSMASARAAATSTPRLSAACSSSTVRARYGDFEHTAIGPDGSLYGASFDGVALLKGGSVSKEAKAAISGTDNGFEGIAVDGRGRIVVATAYGMFIKDGAAWKKATIPGLDDQPFFRSVFTASGARVGAVYMNGIVVQKSDGWEVIKPSADMETIVGGGAADNGDLYILGYHTLYIVRPDGKQVVVYAKSAAAAAAGDTAPVFKASQLDSVDGDAQGPGLGRRARREDRRHRRRGRRPRAADGLHQGRGRRRQRQVLARRRARRSQRSAEQARPLVRLQAHSTRQVRLADAHEVQPPASRASA